MSSKIVLSGVLSEPQSFAKIWKIPKPLLDRIKDVKSGYGVIKSNIFKLKSLPGVSYQLVLHGNYQKMDLFFQANLSFDMTIKCEHHFSVEGVAESRESGTNIMYSGPNLCVIRMLPNIIDELNKNPDFLVFKIMGTMQLISVEKGDIVKPQVSDALFLDEEHKDVTIFVGADQYKVHGWILEGHLPAFDSAVQKQLHLGTDFCAEVVKIVVEFFYEKQFWDTLRGTSDEEKISYDILRFSNRYHMPILKDAIETYLMATLKYDNLQRLANLSIECDAKCLREVCVTKIITAFKVPVPVHVPDSDKIDPVILTEVATRQFSSNIHSSEAIFC